MKVTVVHAFPGRQVVVDLQVEPGATAGSAAFASGLGHPGMELGIAGRRVPAARRLEDGDRVEILRPLAADPIEARRKRARRQRAG